MESEILANFKPMIEAYRQIERLEDMLKQPLSPSLQKLTEKMQAEAVTLFLAHLDREVDMRLAELMDHARYTLADEIIQRDQEHGEQQARPTSSLVLAH